MNTMSFLLLPALVSIVSLVGWIIAIYALIIAIKAMKIYIKKNQ